MPRDLFRDLVTAERIVRGAAEVIRGVNDRTGRAKSSPDRPHDVVTEADLAAEAYIRQGLRVHFAGDGILGEEGAGEGLDRPYVWIIDPIDGTLNYAHGLPGYATLLTLLEDGMPILGLALSPETGALYAASRQTPFTLDGEIRRPSSVTDPKRALILLEHASRTPRTNTLLHEKCDAVFQKTRSIGGGFGLAYVCAGNAEAYVHMGLALWDFAHAGIFAERTGALLTDHEGKPHFPKDMDEVAGHLEQPYRHPVICATPRMHPRVLEVVQEALAETDELGSP